MSTDFSSTVVSFWIIDALLRLHLGWRDKVVRLHRDKEQTDREQHDCECGSKLVAVWERTDVVYRLADVWSRHVNNENRF